MGSLAFRDAVVTALVGWADGRSDCRLYLENGAEVDIDTDETPVVSVEIHYTGSEQADINARPMTRDDGSILITILVRQMTGMRTAYGLREELAALLQRNDFGGARTHTARKLPNTAEVKGWVGYRLAVPFWHYHLD